jgi:hypothetical protein
MYNYDHNSDDDYDDDDDESIIREYVTELHDP